MNKLNEISRGHHWTRVALMRAMIIGTPLASAAAAAAASGHLTLGALVAVALHPLDGGHWTAILHAFDGGHWT